MKDIYSMTEQELRDFNKIICTLIREKMKVQSQKAASAFHIGQRVSFKTGKGMFDKVEIARIESINSKSISVVTIPEGKKWRVGPALLKPYVELVPAKPTNAFQREGVPA